MRKDAALPSVTRKARMNQKTARRIARVIAICVGALSLAFALNAVVHHALMGFEKRRYPAPGEMVDVNARRMHVYHQGSADTRIVLLSGFGTVCPVLDFKPLVLSLSPDYTAIVVESFGYGWSDGTDRDRSIYNIVEETRTALEKGGFAPPYILLAHSISGRYVLYWADRYPREVEGVVGLDMAVPEILKCVDPVPPPYFIGFLRKIGMVRLAIGIAPSLARLPVFNGEEYSREDLHMIKLMTAWNAFNDTVLGESRLERENARQVMETRFPARIPVLQFLSQDTADFVESQKWKLSWLELHERVVRGVEKTGILVLPGGHYLHWTNAEKIAEEIRHFFGTGSN